MATDRERLLELLKTLSFQQREVILASGRRSNFYIDCKQTALTAEGHYLIGRLFNEEIRKGAGVDAVAGVTLGGDPLVSAVSLTSWLEKSPLPALIIRKELKGHGTEAWIEGLRNVKPGARIAVLEDVVTTGGSTLKACQKVRDAGYEVAQIIVLVDRQEGGRENVVAAGYQMSSLFCKADFIKGE
ncbi:MAG: orotate phosphoribosyltransferase [Myxococcota bacterium]|jgi:orotate phosphoribosyltransferase